MKLARLGEGPEVFYSLQGEGVHQGAPSVFVRTSGCNLFCQWCDTSYTWNWKGTPFVHRSPEKFSRAANTIELSVKRVLDCIVRHRCQRVVLTGGEPMLQQIDLVQLLQALRRERPELHAEVETNGTQMPLSSFDECVDLYTVSPKLSNAGMSESLRLRPEALAFLASSAKAVFKFVVRSAADVDEVGVLAAQYEVAADRIYILPEADTLEQLDERVVQLSELCLSHGYRLSDRLHLRLFGNRRGT